MPIRAPPVRFEATRGFSPPPRRADNGRISWADPMRRMLAHFLCLMSFTGTSGAQPAEPVPRIKLERFIAKIDRPVEVTHDPLGRLVVVEQPGRASFVEPGGKV